MHNTVSEHVPSTIDSESERENHGGMNADHWNVRRHNCILDENVERNCWYLSKTCRMVQQKSVNKRNIYHFLSMKEDKNLGEVSG